MNHAEMIMVIQAHSEGKTIEYDDNLIWKAAGNPLWDFSRRNYRVKPEPVYKVTTVDTGREVFKYVSINALEDCLKLFDLQVKAMWVEGGNIKLKALKELIK